jgi:hypothetical protein
MQRTDMLIILMTGRRWSINSQWSLAFCLVVDLEPGGWLWHPLRMLCQLASSRSTIQTNAVTGLVDQYHHHEDDSYDLR